jgi:phage baseplate assembly protein W
MRGTDKHTGKSITGIPRLRQSIEDILTTRIGARVMRRDYGSRLPELIDNPITPAFIAPLTAAIAEALKQEPEFVFESIDPDSLLSDPGTGRLTLTLRGRATPDNRPLTLEEIAIA